MSTKTISETVHVKIRLKIILLTTLLAGSLDILSAILSTYIRFGLGPDRVFKFIASGLFGSNAFSGGIKMVLAGIILHYFIALIWTVIFFIVFPKLKFKQLNKFVVGFLYGIFVWLIMNLIVVPISNTPKITFTTLGVTLGALYLILFIGMPNSLIYHKYKN